MSSVTALTPGFLFLSKRASLVIHSSILGQIIAVPCSTSHGKEIVRYKFMALDDGDSGGTDARNGSKDQSLSPPQASSLTLPSSPRPRERDPSPAPTSFIPIYSVTPDQQLNHQDKLPDIKVNEDTDAILYFDTVSSTQSILEQANEMEELTELDIVVTARVQVEGRGRRSIRCWTSPEGCAMATFNHRLGLGSVMGKKLGFIQHLVSLSIVISFPEIPDLKIKWPNDVYFRNNKIAGLIVNCSMAADQRFVSVFIGFGVNVDNKEPSDYINRILREEYKSETKFTTGHVISRVINNFKNLVNSITSESIFKQVKERYVENWMHTNQEITLGGNCWRILGVDDQGFLSVKDVNSGMETSIGMDFEDFSLPVPSANHA